MSNHEGVHQSSTDMLAKVMSLAMEVDVQWDETQDLRPMLDHQLAASLEKGLTETQTVDAETLRDVVDQMGGGDPTFMDLFNHPAPPIELLGMVKRYTKACRSSSYPLLPEAISTALYYACLATAWLRHRHKLSSLQDDTVVQGWRWAIDEPWLTPSLRNLLQEALEAYP